MKSKISFYIPAFNSENTIVASIKSIYEQTILPDEVIVVDDCSSDNTNNLIKTNFPEIKLIENKKNMGLGYSRNTAIKNCENELIASIDSDVELNKNWIENLLNEFENKNNVMCGGKMTEKFIRNKVNKWRSKYYSQNWGQKKIVNPAFLFGCNTIILKSKWKSVHGYDDKLFTNGEDIDFSSKIKNMEESNNIIYQPAAECYHLQDDNISSLSKRVWRYHSYGYKIKKPSLKKFVNLSIKQIRFFLFRFFENIFKLEFENIKISFFVLKNFIKLEFENYNSNK